MAKNIIKHTKPKPKKKVKNTEQNEEKLITALILCDLPGHRMKSYGSPSLININGKYLIDIQIEAIIKTFVNVEIVICVGFDAEKIYKHVRAKYKNINIRFVENQLYLSCNSCESIRLGMNNTLNTNIVIIDGNLLINKKMLHIIDIDNTCAIIEKYPHDNLEIGININHQNIAQHFSFGAYKTWSEVFYICGLDATESLRKFLNYADSKKKFAFEAFNDLLKHKYQIKCLENKFPVYKINNIKTYHNIKEHYEIFNI